VVGADVGLRNLSSNLSVEGLTQVSPDGRAVPRLAESWQWEDAGRSLRVTLRRNVVFHDGTALTAPLAADVLNRLIGRPGNRALFPSLLDIIDVVADGELDIVFRLSRPSAFLPEDLDLPFETGTPPVGTGPFRIVSATPTEIQLERFDRYYRGVPSIGRIIVRAEGALRTAWSALLRGDVDMVTEVPPDAVQFVSNDDVQVVSFSRNYQYVIAFNSQKPPFDKAAVRRALNIAIDRQGIVQSVLQGRAVPSTGPLWPQHWAYDSSIQGYDSDPAAAIAFLESAGLRLSETPGAPPARLRFTCLIPEGFSLVERLALDIQKQLYGVGVDMQVEVVRPQDFDGRVRSGEFEAIFMDLVGGPSLGRAYVFWGSAKSFTGLNLFGYENSEAERLFNILKTTTNEAAIRSATSALQRVLLNDPPGLFIAWNERARAVRREFRIVQDPRQDPADPIYTIWRWTPESVDGPVVQ
jgi:peptide/nickel transport system substrate-binding protein